MNNFIHNYLTKRSGIKKYEETVNKFLLDGGLDSSEQKTIDKVIKEFNLKKEDLTKAKEWIFSRQFSKAIEDQRISEQEKSELEELLKYFDMSQQEVKMDQKTFNKYYTLALIDKGLLPSPEVRDGKFDIVLGRGEKLHWACPAELLKYRKTVSRINYSGLTGSTRIGFGFRYRAGSINVSREVSAYLNAEDRGFLWLTNLRFGFKGNRKSFSLAYRKVLSFEINNNGLIIFKEGKEQPYILRLEDYDVPASIISFLLNS